MPHTASTSTHRDRPVKRITLALLVCLTLISATPVSAAQPVPAANASVIATWNGIAVSTVTAAGPSPTNFNYFAFVHLAMYNAVVGITRDYELYEWEKRGPRKASPEAAAAAAAHRVLLHYFPGSHGRLDAQLAASLAGVADGSSEQQGIAYGEAAADHIIVLRLNDGRTAPITFDQAPAPGVWRSTPPAPTEATRTAISRASNSLTLRPASASARAHEQPVIPPPTTATSATPSSCASRSGSAGSASQ